MCGIVGYIGKRNANDFLIEGLRRLEYRGYDSAGIVSMQHNELHLTKAVGKVSELAKKMQDDTSVPTVGIAHTRWATHGKPSEINAHPHSDCSGTISLVHNGIVENYQELKDGLKAKGHVFVSETDSEVIAHLLEEQSKTKSFEEALMATLPLLRGTYGIAALSLSAPDTIFVARLGSPLVIGVGMDEYMIASDVSAMVGHAHSVIYLEDGEVARITAKGYQVKTLDNTALTKKEQTLEWSEEQAQKDGFDHFMLKEIFEQPKSFEDALRGRLVTDEGRVKLGGLSAVEDRLRSIRRIIIVSCGTSYHAGLIGEYMLEEYAGIPVEVEYASEFRYRKPLLDEHTAVIALSQSGETADTLAAIREAKHKGALTLGIVNVVGSSIARETDAGIYNHAGPEVSVASTKAFTSQLAILALITVYLGRQRDMSLTMGKRITEELERLSDVIEQTIHQAEAIKTIANTYQDAAHFMYLGRKYNMPIALEGALKIKEIAYVAAQGYPTGEMKHGPIALIDEKAVCIFIAPKDSVYEKNVSGLEEIKARGGKVIVITTEGNDSLKEKADAVIHIPKTLELLTPIIASIPLQLFAYYVSVAKGYDVDRPRNLAKSVTVE